MNSQIKTLSYPNGEIQRVQLVRPDSWDSLHFFRPRHTGPVLEQIANIYRTYLVPACPWIFGQMVLFSLPEDCATRLPTVSKRYGALADPLTAAAAALEEGVQFIGSKPQFSSEIAEALWQELEDRHCVQIVSGRLPFTKIIPVGRALGPMTASGETAALKVNASFFILDCFDCATAYDHVGTPFGLCVKDGVILAPPLYHREALFVKRNGDICVRVPELEELVIEIGGKRYQPGRNAEIITRPTRRKTQRRAGQELVIIGDHVAAVHDGGATPIPASGFVLRPAEFCSVAPGDTVVYHGMEDVLFGIQAGNSIVRQGEKTKGFISPFYNILNPLQRIPFPPSLYPLNFKKKRAARIALGADAEGRPLLLWAEGAGKLRYEKGRDSRGASLSELGEICTDLGMVNAVNLDGGGSAQILLQNERSLRLSDRDPKDNSEMERAVPLGLMVSEA